MANIVYIDSYRLSESSMNVLSLSGSIRVDAQIEITGSQTVNRAYFCLTRLAVPGVKPAESRYWLISPSTQTSTTVYASIDITSNVMEGNGLNYYLFVGTSNSTQTLTNSLTRPTGSASNTSNYSLNLSFSSSSSGVFETSLLYPVIKKTPHSGTARKIIFKIATSVGPKNLADISLSYNINNEIKQYLWSSSSNLFEIRYKNGSTWSNLIRGSSIDPDGVYGVFNAPDYLDNNISNIKIMGIDEDAQSSGEITEQSSFDRINLDSLLVKTGDLFSNVIRANLISTINNYSDAYTAVVSEFGLTPLGTISSSGKNPLVDNKPCQKILEFYKNTLYGKLHEVFPVSYNSSVMENLQTRATGEIAIANTNPPSLSNKANLFNNIVWVLKNIL